MFYNEETGCLSIHRVVFKKTLPKKIKNKFEKQVGLKKKACEMKSKQWTFSSGVYVRNNWKQLFTYMQSCHCQKLLLNSNSYPLIFKTIRIPQYRKLKSLILDKNQILSIEDLAFIRMENIELISMNWNQITTTKSISKLKFPKLRSIQVRRNHYQAIDISRMKRRPVIDVEDSYNAWISPVKHDITCLVKWEIKQINEISLSFGGRIPQQKVYQVMKRKCQKQAIETSELL